MESAIKVRDDIWAKAWGSVALQDLGRSLVQGGISEKVAALAVDRTWLFYSYFVLPVSASAIPMAIALKQTPEETKVCLLLPIRLGHGSSNDLHRKFKQEVADPLNQYDVVMNLDPVRDRTLVDIPLSESFSRYCAMQGIQPVGIFEDDLEAELATVMAPEDASAWLNQPNTHFDQRKPSEFLHDPQDTRLRNMITRAKFDLTAA